MEYVITNAEVESKKDSDIVTVPLPLMVAPAVLVTPKQYELAIHINVQVRFLDFNSFNRWLLSTYTS